MLGHHDEPRGMFAGASPKLTFLFGLVLGLAIVSILGFAVLLYRGNMFSGTTPVNNGVVVQPSPTDQPAPQEGRVGDHRAISSDDHIRGSANAPLTLLEYSDTECPYCKQFHVALKDTLAKHDGKVRWVFRHFPIPSLHSKAPKEAEALECAAELGGNDKFWAYLDRLFAVTPSNDGLDPAELPKIAAAVGLNATRFSTCLNSGKYAAKVSADEQDAQTAGQYMDRLGTPFTVVILPDGSKIPIGGAVSAGELDSMLTQLLAQ